MGDQQATGRRDAIGHAPTFGSDQGPRAGFDQGFGDLDGEGCAESRELPQQK